jgi:hypothetical protein
MVKYVKYVYSNKTKSGTKHTGQGLIPDRIWNREEIQKYVKDYPFGYIGSTNRRKTTDKAVMKYFRDAKKSDKFISDEFLTNSIGRHMSDSFYKDSESQIYKKMEKEFGKVKKAKK